MFGWLGFLKRKKETPVDNGPLSDLKTVTRWMQTLPVGDIHGALEQVVKRLIEFNHTQAPFTKERLQVLMHLDEEAREMHASLCEQYLRNPRMSKNIEAKLWMVIHAFLWEVTRGYHAFLMDFVANPGGGKFQGMVPQITARAIRGFAHIIKWRYFRYEQIDDKLWLRLHNLYRIAEFDGFAGTALKVYSNELRQHSAMDEYIQALFMSLTGGNGSLSPRQVEMLDHWLDNWSHLLRLDTAFNAERHTFYTDTSKGFGLRRVRNQGNDPNLRYIDAAPLLEHLEQVIDQIKLGATPVTLGLGEDFHLPEGMDLLETALFEWSPLNSRERRGSPRQPADGKWQIIRDLPNLFSALEVENPSGKEGEVPLTPEEILDIKLYGFVTDRTRAFKGEGVAKAVSDIMHDLWDQLDSSESGIGFSIGPKDSDWMKVGKLVGMRVDSDQHWQTGVIRRIARHDDGNRIVGVNLFQGKLRPVKLEPDRASMELSLVGSGYSVNDYNTAYQTTPALLLAERQDGEAIILESAKYNHGKRYVLRCQDGQTRLVALDKPLDKGDGWLKASFRVVAS